MRLSAVQGGALDIGFAQSMSLHHQQAIGMAQLLLDGRPTALGALARGIAATQGVELGEMRGWLRLWQAPLQRAARDMDWMLLGRDPLDPELRRYLLDCRQSAAGMNGLATLAELETLRATEGRARDKQFLRLMLAHHEGGLPMARFAAREASLAVVREMAARVVLEQSEEITRIRRMLQALAMAENADGAVPPTAVTP